MCVCVRVCDECTGAACVKTSGQNNQSVRVLQAKPETTKSSLCLAGCGGLDSLLAYKSGCKCQQRKLFVGELLVFEV